MVSLPSGSEPQRVWVEDTLSFQESAIRCDNYLVSEAVLENTINYLGIKICIPTFTRKEPGFLLRVLAQPVEHYRSPVRKWWKERAMSSILVLTLWPQ